MIYLLSLIITVVVSSASAATDFEVRVSERMAKMISDRLYPGTRIELQKAPEIEAGATELTVTGETSAGTARYSYRGADGEIQLGTVAFSAYMPAYVAVRRMFPGEKLERENFKVQEVNVSSGLGREYRGLILLPPSDLSHLEARQSVIEGQFLVSSSIQKMPDVRRGDAIRIRLTAGEVTLMTTGTVSEPAYLDQTVRVITLKTKRDLVGKLKADKTVEVTL